MSVQDDYHDTTGGHDDYHDTTGGRPEEEAEQVEIRDWKEDISDRGPHEAIRKGAVCSTLYLVQLPAQVVSARDDCARE